MRIHVQPLLLWTILWGGFFGTILLGWARFPNSDFSGQFHAFAAFQARMMANGQLPLWSDGSFGGVPFVADVQAAVFYWPRWITIGISTALIGPLSYYALELEALLHIWVLGAGLYGFVFHMLTVPLRPGETTLIDPRLVRWVALLAAVSFALGGYVTSYPLLQLAVLETVTWLPLILLALRQAAIAHTPQASLRWHLLTSLFLATALTAGHPQTFVHISYVASATYFFTAGQVRWSWAKQLIRGGLLGGLALLAGTAAWLPAIVYAPLTVRAEATYDFVSSGQTLINFWQLLVPSSRTFWTPEYVGLAAFLLALFGWQTRMTITESRRAENRRAESRRAESRFWGILTVVATWLSLGNKGILFALWYWIAPGFSLFRQQERLIGIVAFGMVILAAHGLATWLSLPRRTSNRAWRRTAGIGFALLGSFFLFAQFAPHAVDTNWFSQWWPQVILLSLFAISLHQLPHRFLPLGLVAMALFSTADLAWGTATSVDRTAESPAVFWPQPEWLTILRQEDARGRFDPGFLYFANIGEAGDLASVRGISPLKPRWLDDLERVPLSITWPLMHVTHGSFLGTPPGDLALTPLAEATDSLIPGETRLGATLYRFDNAGPRAWMSYTPWVVADQAAALATMKAGGFDPATQVLVTEDVAANYQVVPPSMAPVVTIQEQWAGHLTVSVETGTAGYLVLSEWAYPGWIATVNGQRKTIHRVNYAFQGIWLPAGTHAVTTTFAPWAVSIGLAISAVAVFIGLLLIMRPPLWLHAPHTKTDVPRFGLTRVPTIIPVIPRAVAGSWAKISDQTARWITQYPVVLLLVGCAFRLFSIGRHDLSFAEATAVLHASDSLLNIIPALIETASLRPPLQLFLLHGWIQLVGDHVFATRTLSALLGLLLLSLLWQLGRRIRPRKRWLPPFLLTAGAFAPGLIKLSQDIGHHYQLTLLLTMVATITILDIVRNADWRHWLSYGTAITALFYHDWLGLLIVPVHGIYLLSFFERTTSPQAIPQRPARRRFITWVVVLAMSVWVATPWLWMVFQNQPALPMAEISIPKLADYLTDIGLELTLGSLFSGASGRWLWLALIMLLLSWQFQQPKPKAPESGQGVRAQRRLLISWLWLTILSLYLLTFRHQSLPVAAVVLALPAWFVLIGSTLGQKRTHPIGRWLPQGVALIWLGAAMVSLFNYYFVPPYSPTDDYQALASHLVLEATPGDVLVLSAPNPTLDYYLRHSPLPQAVVAYQEILSAETEAELRALIADHERLWLLSTTAPDPTGTAPNYGYLDANTILEQERTASGLRLTAFRPLHALDAIAAPVKRQLGDTLTLEHAILTIDGQAATLDRPMRLPPGAQLDITVVWSAQQPIDISYTVFVHLLAADGRLLAQHDGIPVDGTRPTMSWRSNEPIIDHHRLLVPVDTTGAATIVVGLYDSVTVERQVFDDGIDAWPLAEGHIVSDEDR